MEETVTVNYVNKNLINDLMRKIQNGNITALDKLYDLLKTPLKKHIKLYIRNEEDVNDILQETMLAVLKKAKGNMYYKNCFGLIYKIADRTIFGFLRAHKNYPVSDDLEKVVDPKSEFELDMVMSLTLSSLTERQLSIIQNKQRGYTHQEISKILDISVSTIERELDIIKKIMRDFLN